MRGHGVRGRGETTSDDQGREGRQGSRRGKRRHGGHEVQGHTRRRLDVRPGLQFLLSDRRGRGNQGLGPGHQGHEGRRQEEAARSVGAWLREAGRSAGDPTKLGPPFRRRLPKNITRVTLANFCH